MPEPMTAKDLHDLVAPLWAAVPETVPTWTYDVLSYRLLYDDKWIDFLWSCNTGPICRRCTPREAEVYIIHAIEEWVLSQTRDLRIFHVDEQWWAEAACGNFACKAESRLHALVGLAMAVHTKMIYDESVEPLASTVADWGPVDDEAEPCCPVGDPSCVSGDDECHDACESPSVEAAGFRSLADAEEAAGSIAAGTSTAPLDDDEEPTRNNPMTGDAGKEKR